jgi:putative transposase
MARPLRVNIEDGWYHCMHRGLERREIFSEPYDRSVFLRVLGETVERYRFVVHAYCLMDNHYHAIIQTPDANLSRGMQWLGLSYSSYYNARHDRVGPLFQGRFKSVPVEDGAWAHDLSLYVHLNPVRTVFHGPGKASRGAERQGVSPPPSAEEAARRLRKLRNYRWSSYRAYAGYEKAPDWLTIKEIQSRSAGREQGAAARYRAQVQHILRAGAEEPRLEAFREVVGLGSAEFIARIKDLAGGGGRETEGRRRLRNRVGFPDVLQAVERLRGQTADQWMGRHGDWGRWMVLKVARENTGMTLRELGEAVGGMDYAAVCMGLSRFEQRMKQERNKGELTEIYKRILGMLYV